MRYVNSHFSVGLLPSLVIFFYFRSLTEL